MAAPKHEGVSSVCTTTRGDNTGEPAPPTGYLLLMIRQHPLPPHSPGRRKGKTDLFFLFFRGIIVRNDWASDVGVYFVFYKLEQF